MNTLRLLSTLFVLSLSSATIQAAVIFDQGHVTGESDFLNTGNVFVANNLGAGAVPVSINGINFGASLAGLSGMSNGGGDFNNQFPSGSPLDQVLSNLAYQGGGNSSLTLSGLTSGADYFLQLFLSNSVNNTGKGSRVTVQGQQYNLINFGNTADYLHISFTATASSEVIGFGTGSTSEAARMILNAYAMSDTTALDTASVPLPAPLALFGLTLPALLRVRAKNH